MSLLRRACTCCRSLPSAAARLGPVAHAAAYSASAPVSNPDGGGGDTGGWRHNPPGTGPPRKFRPGGSQRKENFIGAKTRAGEDVPDRPVRGGVGSPRGGDRRPGQGGGGSSRTPAARFEPSERPPRSSFAAGPGLYDRNAGGQRGGERGGPSQGREPFGGGGGRGGRGGGAGSYGRGRPDGNGEGRFGMDARPARGGRPLPNGGRLPRPSPPSEDAPAPSTPAPADDAVPDDDAPYNASSSRGRGSHQRGPPGRPGAESEKSSRSYRAAEGEFTLSRGRERRDQVDGGGREKERGRGKDRDEMNLARVRSERERTKKPKEVESRLEKKVFVPSSVSVGRLAHIFDVKIFNLQRTMQRLGLSEDQRRSDYLLTSEEACNIALEYGLDPTVDDERTFDIFPEPDAEGVVQPLRPPVVTIMGHVDHGKTTLLDSLRDSSVATGEAGGITQHIGAFSVPLSSLLPSAPADSSTPGTITFLDTPGHAAFTAMRARGASVTDMVVLVVAADDGVMPQTKEVIELWKADQDKVGLVVAINKCDKPGIDFDKIKSALGAEGILLEEDGGDVPSVRVSGLKKEGLDKLVETLSTLAEIRELRARTTGKMEGYVLESRVDRGQGNVATVLVSKGTLSAGTCIVAGTTWARVRQMQDSAGRSLRSAPPGTPVSIMGWRDLPSAGDQLLEASNEDEAKKAISNRLREIERKKLLADVESINIKRVAERKKVELEEEGVGRLKEEGKSEAEIQVWKREFERQSGAEEEGGKKELRLVVKGDVSGSVEAVVGSLEGIGNAQAGVKIVHVGVGEVGESDVHMAEAGKASIIAFSVPTSRSTQNLARTLNVPLHSDSVIYRLIETVRSEVIKLLPAVYESRVTGEAVVQQVFEIKMKGKEVVKIAGCKVGNGVVESKEGVGIRVLRGADRVQVYEGTIETLKHLKKDVTEVRKGTECGISFHGFTDVREGDEIIAFTKFEVPRHL